MPPFLTWLIQGAVGPAVFGLPATLAATDLARAAQRWFRRLRRSDGLSRIVRAAASDVHLSDAEFTAVRELLEQESTWMAVGRGTVEDLAIQIASCLPDPDSKGSLAAGRAIAGGLLEFAVHDLEPEWFPRVLFARLDRLETRQGSALDEVVLSLHADLAAQLAHQDAEGMDRFVRVMGQLGRVLDRLPPGPADQREVTVYLATLIRWLNADAWPEEPGSGRRVLTPAAIERKLRIASSRDLDEQDLDADDLASRCARLVVLGGPGSGKTWLARRTARRCAEAALAALATGAGLDEIELPLYTTCAHLSAASPGDGIRRAVVASALGQLPDLGGSRVTDALQELFEDRGTPTLLVADSLDEARGADDRIRQADTLPAAWRIVLTTRPGSWNRQFAIRNDDPSRLVGTLQPLRYPDDVEQSIAAWFVGAPERAANLATQLRDHPALQQSARVPLILAFYCILGGDQPLPNHRADLYDKVIRRMLTARWRGGSDRDPDTDMCLEILRDWAWSAAASNPVSGVGNWADEFLTRRVRSSQDDREALDHVAVPLGRPDVDSGQTRRRFVHRSIQEHLVGKYIAMRMPAAEAAKELLNHLWYDPDWEYTAPYALALHPERDQVLKDLINRLTGADPRSADLAAVDECWELRRFLARVAQESREGDWQCEAAEVIGQARLAVAKSWGRGLGSLRQVVVTDWPTSNRLILSSLLQDNIPMGAGELADEATELAATAEDRAQTRETLLGLLAAGTRPWMTLQVAEALASLDPTIEDRARARDVLLGLLAAQTGLAWAAPMVEAIARLDSTTQDRARIRQLLLGLLALRTGLQSTVEVAEIVARLDPAPDERARVRDVLLGLLTDQTSRQTAGKVADVLVGLATTAEDRARTRQLLLGLLAAQTGPHIAAEVAEIVARLDPAPDERARVRDVLLGLLTDQTSRQTAGEVADALVGLATTGEDRARTRQLLLGLLAARTSPSRAGVLAAVLARLDPAPDEQAWAREVLLGLLTDQTSRQTPGKVGDALVGLATTAEDRARIRQVLLDSLAAQTSPTRAAELAEVVVRLDPTGEDRARAMQVLLDLLAADTNPDTARWLAYLVAELGPTAEDRARATQLLLDLLADLTDLLWARPLAFAVAWLGLTTEEGRRAAQILLGLLAAQTDHLWVGELTRALVRLGPTADDRAQAVQVLLGMLGAETNPETAQWLADLVAWLGPTAEDRARAMQVLLNLLAAQNSAEAACWLAEAAARLDPASEDRARALQMLLSILATETNFRNAEELADAIAELNPTVAELYGSDNWYFPPSQALLIAARQNSAASIWVRALPWLSTYFISARK